MSNHIESNQPSNIYGQFVDCSKNDPVGISGLSEKRSNIILYRISHDVTVKVVGETPKKKK